MNETPEARTARQLAERAASHAAALARIVPCPAHPTMLLLPMIHCPICRQEQRRATYAAQRLACAASLTDATLRGRIGQADRLEPAGAGLPPHERKEA